MLESLFLDKIYFLLCLKSQRPFTVFFFTCRVCIRLLVEYEVYFVNKLCRAMYPLILCRPEVCLAGLVGGSNHHPLLAFPYT